MPKSLIEVEFRADNAEPLLTLPPYHREHDSEFAQQNLTQMYDKGIDCPNFDKLPISYLLRILQWKSMALFYHIIDIPSVVLFLLSGAALVVSTGYSIFHLIFSQYSYGMRLKTTALAKSSLNS